MATKKLSTDPKAIKARYTKAISVLVKHGRTEKGARRFMATDPTVDPAVQKLAQAESRKRARADKAEIPHHYHRQLKAQERGVKCPECGSKDLAHASEPSMAGYGEDWSVSCRFCGWQETGHPSID